MGGVAWQALNNLRQCPSSSRQNVILMEKFDQRYHALLQSCVLFFSGVSIILGTLLCMIPLLFP